MLLNVLFNLTGELPKENKLFSNQHSLIPANQILCASEIDEVNLKVVGFPPVRVSFPFTHDT